MKIISETLINVVHFAQSIVHSISKINWGRFGDHFRVGDRFGLGSLRTLYSTLKQAIIAVLIKCIYCFHIKLQNVITNRIHFSLFGGGLLKIRGVFDRMHFFVYR